MILKRLAAAVGLGLVGALAFGTAASAHVTVNPNSAVQGGYARLAFRVPTESDSASTVKVEVTLPEDAPVASVSTQPVPGWTAVVERRTLPSPIEVYGSEVTEVASKITWTAGAGASIKPGEFQEFPVSMGPLPETDQMVFKALQTYSDGEIVRWIDEPVAAGAEEPESPAPVLKLTAAAADDPAAGPSVSASAPSSSSSSSGAALGVGIAGLVLGAAGLVLGGVAFRRTRHAA
jgi:periplasmic copper chaperone A